MRFLFSWGFYRSAPASSSSSSPEAIPTFSQLSPTRKKAFRSKCLGLHNEPPQWRGHSAIKTV